MWGSNLWKPLFSIYARSLGLEISQIILPYCCHLLNIIFGDYILVDRTSQCFAMQMILNCIYLSYPWNNGSKLHLGISDRDIHLSSTTSFFLSKSLHHRISVSPLMNLILTTQKFLGLPNSTLKKECNIKRNRNSNSKQIIFDGIYCTIHLIVD